MSSFATTVAPEYPRIEKWPELPEPAHLWMHFKQDDRFLLVGPKVFTELGISVGDSYTIAQHGARLLLWKSSDKTPLGHFRYTAKRLTPISKPAGVAEPYAVASCGTHAVLAPLSEIRVLAPNAAKRRGFQGQKQSEMVVEQASTYPLSAADVVAWMDLKSLAYDSVSMTPVTGRLLAIAGLEIPPGRDIVHLKGTRYSNGLFLQLSAEAAGGIPVGKTNEFYSRVLLTTSLLPFTNADTYRAIATKDGLLIVQRRQSEAKLCLPKTNLGLSLRKSMLANPNTVISGDTATLGKYSITADWVARTPGGVNTAYYARKNIKRRLQVHGQWLADFGFVAGARFRLETHPAFKKRLRAVLDPAGPHQVTSYANTLKLYVPESSLGDKFEAPFIRVLGVHNDGLHFMQAPAHP